MNLHTLWYPRRIQSTRAVGTGMIRKSSHGFFRGSNCPTTNEEGKFIMSDREGERLGRIMALVLRHAPEKFGLEMDLNGWVNMNDFAVAVQNKNRRMHWIRQHHFQAITEVDEKGRYEFKGGMVRATYAHSVDIELDLPTDDIPDVAFFPVERGQEDEILGIGLLPGDRRHVHLSRTFEGAWEAGSVHHDLPVIIEVDCIRAVTDGYTFHRAGHRVILVEEVPPAYISIVSGDDGRYEDARAAAASEEE